jgi:6-phosphofructokinase 1
MRIGILTGGGDVPGLNSCIKALVYRAIDEGHEVVGFRRGWMSLLGIDVADPDTVETSILPLDKQNTRTIDRTGGTFLHTSRTNPAKVKPSETPMFLRRDDFDERDQVTLDFTPHVLEVLEHLGVDVLVPIGGDDTLNYGARLCEENFPVIAIPKTMDNDVFGTDYTIGFSTAVTRSVDFVQQLRTTIGSHERLGVIELFGRNSGATCLVTAHLAGVDRTVISEVPFDIQKLARFLVADKRANPSNYAIALISEGARFIGGEIIESGQEDAYGHKKLGGVGELTTKALKELTGLTTLYQRLAYLMRSGVPDALDIMVAINFAHMTLDLIDRGEFGRMVALKEGKYTHVPANSVTQGIRQVDVNEFYDVENYRPKLRIIEGKPMFLY